MNNGPHSPTVRRSAIVSGLVSAIVAIAFLLVFGGDLSSKSAANQPVQSQQSAVNQITPERSTSTVVDVVAEARSSVVSITVSERVPQIEKYYQQGPFGIRIPRQEIEGFQRRQIGSGSGFFVSNDGLIVTNRHVVSNSDASYSAVTSEGETHELEVVGRDPFLDIAVLKVKNNSDTNFEALSFGDSETLQPGQSVVAIGNALGEFRNSVSVGVISGLSRSILAGGRTGPTQRLDKVIQTDAAINPGNSGGPLLNLSGEVIGVNVAIAQGSENISFAIPSNLTKEVVSSVKEYGEVVRPFLGVRYVPVTETIAQQRNLSVSHGALVTGGPTEPSVTSGSAADKAGIQPGDVILSLGGQKIDEDNRLNTIIRNYSVGDKVTITLLRDGEKMTVEATLQRAPETMN